MTLLTYEEEEGEDFKFLVESMNQKNTNIRIRYAKQFGCIHQTGNTQSLLQLSTKLHVMKSLTCLSKFLRCHNTAWVNLKRK